jgi:hypothetical protein
LYDSRKARIFRDVVEIAAHVSQHLFARRQAAFERRHQPLLQAAEDAVEQQVADDVRRQIALE